MLYNNIVFDIRRSLFYTLFLALLSIVMVGCASVSYVGDEYQPTQEVELFMSEDEITREYTTIGHALGSGFLVKNKKIRKKLMEEAKKKGANAILITGVGRGHIPSGSGTSLEEQQVNVEFLRYK